jgi:hypothetical protein
MRSRVFRLVIDPALLFPPKEDALRPSDWVMRTQSWGALAASEAISASCPRIVAQRASAMWWEKRTEIADALAAHDDPLDHGELARIVDEIASRLDESPLESHHDVVFNTVTLTPAYIAGGLAQSERSRII